MTPSPLVLVLAGLLALFVVLVLAALIIDRRYRGDASKPGIGFLRWVNLVYSRVFHALPARGEDPLPSSGAAIVVANHRSGVDPLVVQYFTKRVIRFMCAREYYEVFGLRTIFKFVGIIPVNRDGNDLAATKAALRALQDGHIIGIFPEGGIRNNGDAPLEGESNEALKHGAAMLALRTGAPVYAAYITGTPPHDSVARAFFSPSRSRVVFSGPEHFEPRAGAKATKEDLERASGRIFELISELRSSLESTEHEAVSVTP